MGACTSVCRAKPTLRTTASTCALPLKCITLRRPPLSFSTSGSVDQIRCSTPASRAALTAAAPISSSRSPWAGSQKLVTTNAPAAPLNAATRLPGSSRSAWTTSTSRAASARAASLAGLRLATRTLNSPWASNAFTTLPPWRPIPPMTLMTLFAIVVLLQLHPEPSCNELRSGDALSAPQYSLSTELLTDAPNLRLALAQRFGARVHGVVAEDEVMRMRGPPTEHEPRAAFGGEVNRLVEGLEDRDLPARNGRGGPEDAIEHGDPAHRVPFRRVIGPTLAGLQAHREVAHRRRRDWAL